MWPIQAREEVRRVACWRYALAVLRVSMRARRELMPSAPKRAEIHQSPPRLHFSAHIGHAALPPPRRAAMFSLGVARRERSAIRGPRRARLPARGFPPPDSRATLRACLVRRHLHTGRSPDIDDWLARLEARLGRRLRPLPVGRPRKERK